MALGPERPLPYRRFMGTMLFGTSPLQCVNWIATIQSARPLMSRADVYLPRGRFWPSISLQAEDHLAQHWWLLPSLRAPHPQYCSPFALPRRPLAGEPMTQGQAAFLLAFSKYSIKIPKSKYNLITHYIPVISLELVVGRTIYTYLFANKMQRNYGNNESPIIYYLPSWLLISKAFQSTIPCNYYHRWPNILIEVPIKLINYDFL